MIHYRRPHPSLIKPGAVVWTDPDPLGIPCTDQRVAYGLVMVRVLEVTATTATFSVFGSSLERAQIASAPLDSFWVQLGAGGDDPTKPTSVQQSPDKPRTQIAYPIGIDASQVHAAPAAAVSARPATMYADSATWQLQCPTCPLSVDGPQMVCCWGKRLPDGAFMLEGKCMHNSGMRKRDGAPADQLLTGCTYSGVGHESD